MVWIIRTLENLEYFEETSFYCFIDNRSVSERNDYVIINHVIISNANERIL